MSDNLFLQTNPKCKALGSDSDNCGWYGHQCAENRRCIGGLCKLKRRMPCDGECGDGETCCWILGTEQCVDTSSDFFHCGSCEAVCECGSLCRDGVCEAWYDVIDPCEVFNLVNCGVGGEIECKDLSNDSDNCGGCGSSCSDAGWCDDGRCLSLAGEVPDGEEG